MDSLKDEPRPHQVLLMPREGEVVPPEIGALRRSGREFLKNCLIPSKEIDGKKPSKQQRKAYTKLQDVDMDTNRIYGLSSQRYLFQLLEYGQINGGFIPRITQMCGPSMFHALRKGMKWPREFTNTHLRRMIVLYIIKNF